MDGMINIRKEKDFTSHDVVAKMRGILKQKKIGHTGTLDPMAEGVLPVAVGGATKLCDMFSDRSKTYRAVVRLGIATDTEDMTGKIISEGDYWKDITEDTLRKTVESFLGEYRQVPPMYSALKVDGRKLYEYARKGIEIEREARLLHIYDIKLLWVDLPEFAIEVSCSKGTYIRTLSKDIGERLGGQACMASLLRTRVGDFELDKAITLSELEQIRDEGRLLEYIVPVEKMFLFMDAYSVMESGEKQLRNGNPIDISHVAFIGNGSGECAITGDWTDCVRIYDSNDAFIGIYRKKEQFKPEKLFFVNNGGK